MSRYRLKICGIRHREEAEFCASAGVDFIGLNFVPASRRCIPVSLGKNILDNLPPIQTVGVFQDQPLSLVNETATELNLDYVQLSGNESPEEIAGCCRPVIKTLSFHADIDLSRIEHAGGNIVFFILDGRHPGSGQTFNWDQIPDLPLPFLLAGGISNDNLREAVARTNPMGLDVASGVETDGEIDRNKIQKMVTTLCSL